MKPLVSKKTMRSIQTLLLSLITVALLHPAANAAVIYDNGAPLLGNAGGGDWSSFATQQLADDFTLSPGANVIGDIHWWGLYPNNIVVPDDFTIRVFNSVGGAPAANPFFELSAGSVTRMLTGDTVTTAAGDTDLYAYWLDISPLTLAPGTPYYLSVVNSPPWYWALSDIGGGNEFERNGGADGLPWSVGLPNDAAFNLTSVPEPGTLGLLGLGLTGLGVSRWIKRRTQV